MDILLFSVLLFIVSGAIVFFSTWILFAIIMWAKHNEDKIPKWAVPIFYALFAIGLVFDVLLNVIWATVWFFELPDFEDTHFPYLPTLSERLRDIRRGYTRVQRGSIRWHSARILCEYFIEPHDPGHCGGSWY